MSPLGPIYAITDPQLLPGEKLYEAVAAALRGGVRAVQLRDKTATDPDLLAMATRLVDLCHSFAASCIVNDRLDIALAAGAQGVHLGQGDGSIATARRLLGDDAIIGATCHADLELARRARDQGASYVAFGRFYSSSTKPEAQAAPLQVLRSARREIALPVVAIGGIDRDNMAPLLQAGAQTLAICHGLFHSADVERTARELVVASRQHL